MPKSLGGKTLSAKEHRQWKKVQQSAKARGASAESAAKQATAAVKKSRKK